MIPPALLMMDRWKCERFRASSALRHHLVQMHHLHSQAQDITIPPTPLQAPVRQHRDKAIATGGRAD